MQNTLPAAGYLREWQLIGQIAVSREEAEANKLAARKIGREIDQSNDPGERCNLLKQLKKIGPRTPRQGIPPIFPWSKSKLWSAVKSGQFPAPVKLSARTTAWRVEDIKKHIETLAA